MGTAKKHVYFVPGLAASTEIFKNIILPAEEYEIHTIEWLIPKKNEGLDDYAKRMCKEIHHDKVVLIGVSFGGVMVQEMSKYLDLEKLIIISSVKTKHELPARLKFARNTKIYKILPTSIIANSKDFTRYSVGPKSRKRLQLYNEFLSVKNSIYLDWSIKQMLCWKRDTPVKNVYHIHGTKDAIMPIKNISECIPIENGTHVMVLINAKSVSRQIRNIIEDL